MTAHKSLTGLSDYADSFDWITELDSVRVQCNRIRLSQFTRPDGVFPTVAESSIVARSILGGSSCWKVRLVNRMGGETTTALAVLEKGRAGNKLTIALSQPPESRSSFGALLDILCDRLGAIEAWVELITGVDCGAQLPSAEGEVSRYQSQRLYVVDLTKASTSSTYAKNTLRNIRKAERAGAVLRISDSTLSGEIHQKLVHASLSRRAARGEDIALRGADHRILQLLTTGSGRFFQVELEGEIQSSNFVFSLGPYAYFYDGGSTPAGMDQGASHFLLDKTISHLRQSNYHTLNLGIAADGNEGLARFKEGFAPEPHFVERLVVRRGSMLQRGKALLRNLLNDY